MNEAKLFDLIRAPHISEKSTRVAEKHRQIVFRVKGKTKRQGRRQDWKKSYVTLAPGHDIDFTGVA